MPITPTDDNPLDHISFTWGQIQVFLARTDDKLEMPSPLDYRWECRFLGSHGIKNLLYEGSNLLDLEPENIFLFTPSGMSKRDCQALGHMAFLMAQQIEQTLIYRD